MKSLRIDAPGRRLGAVRTKARTATVRQYLRILCQGIRTLLIQLKPVPVS